MTIFLYIIIGLCFVGLLISNIYFRVKMMKHYKALVNGDVIFEAMDVFSNKKMALVRSRYPNHKKLISEFENTFKLSIKIILGLIGIILICGIIFYFF